MSDRSAYIGYIIGVCVVVAVSRSGSFMVDVKKWHRYVGLMGSMYLLRGFEFLRRA